jgi:hypothetical protein
MATQQHNAQLNFLQEKIQEIGSALFFNLSDSVLKLPTSLVQTLKVDDYGFVWLTMKRPKQQVKEFEAEFPVQLDYYKKGVGSYLQVCGKGWTVSDPEEMTVLDLSAEEIKKLTLQQEAMLVKVKILKAEFYETKTAGRQTWWQNIMNSLTAWFRNNQYRPNIYYPAS